MDRIEWFLEKAVDIGIQHISFVQTKNSERKNLKLDRLQRIAISALKQSQQYYLPQVTELKSIRDFIEGNSAEHKFVANQDEGGKRYLGDALHGPGDITVLIGPEGDFIEEEINLLKQKGYLPISLGNNRLRTETAALVACTELSLLARS
jgi:16S rRNA (uracil1498-N3)-methyltransferase